MSFKFKVGDRVRAIAACDDKEELIGKTGTVVGVMDYTSAPIGVKFDKKFSAGHDLGGNCENGYGRWCEESSLELIADDGELKVGDKVIYVGAEKAKYGGIGTIKHIRTSGTYTVEFEKNFGGHSGGGVCMIGHGWYCEKEYLRKLTPLATPEYKQEPKTIKITVAGLDSRYKYIARDMDGSLFAYVEKPVIDVGGLQWYGKQYKALDSKLFKEIKWGDGPVEINQGD